MKKIAFFFGAGAEGKGNFDIRTGYEFLRSTLYAKDSLRGFDDDLSKFFSDNRYFNNRYKYRKDFLQASSFVLKNFIIQKSSQDTKFYQRYNKIICSLLNKDDIKRISDVLDLKSSENNSSSELSDEEKNDLEVEFKKIITNNISEYSNIKNSIFKELFSQGENDSICFDVNIGMGGSLDSYFHTIIDPYKYGIVRFSKVFNYYWASYFAILNDVIKFLVKQGQKDFEKYLSTEDKLNYLFVLQNINELTSKLYTINIKELMPQNSYYQIIHQKLEKYRNEIKCVGVATTNYYRFCESVFTEAIYLNGQLKYFEYPEILEVVDMSSNCAYKNKFLFPFIFGQSLVKPIVNSTQIKEFWRLNKLLNGDDGADILVVLGFNINEDDNHINAFLHDYVKKGKKLIIVSDDKEFNVERKLKCSRKEVTICKVAYGNNEEVIEKLFNEILKDE